MNHESDSDQRARVLLNHTLDHFHASQDYERLGDHESARSELAMAEQYRDMYWYRIESAGSRRT